MEKLKTRYNVLSHQVYLKVIWLQNPGVIFPHLQELEKRFFEIVTDGNIPEARVFLEDHPEFNINATNFQVSTRVHNFLRAIPKNLGQTINIPG